MEYAEYKKLYDSLVYPEDVEKRVSEGYDMVKSNTKRMLKDWNNGKSFLEI